MISTIFKNVKVHAAGGASAAARRPVLWAGTIFFEVSLSNKKNITKEMQLLRVFWYNTINFSEKLFIYFSADILYRRKFS